MPKLKFLQNNFTSGQLSPLLGKRSDFERFKNGAKTIKNFSVMPQGGVTARTGSKFIAETKDSNAVSHFIPFKFSTTDAYMIEVGNLYMRFYKDSGLILESDKVITAITKDDPAVITSVAHGYSDGDQFYATEIVGMTEVNDANLYYTVSNKTDDTLELQDRDGNDVDSTAFTTYASAGVMNKIFEITTTYVEADIPDLDFTQSGDTITITHTTYETRDLVRSGDTSWTLTTKLLTDGPYLDENTTTTTLALSGTTGSVTVTASSIVGINGGTGFQTTDVDRLIRFHDGTNFTWLLITARASTTSVTATIKGADAAVGTATDRWRLGAFSDTTGWAEKTTYYQQRLILTKGEDIFGSAIDDFPNFTPGTDDANAIKYTVASGEVNDIKWVASSKRLRIGTEGGVLSLWGGSVNTAITPTNAVASFETNIRCKEIKPISIGNSTLFLQRTGKTLRELIYNFDVDGLVSPDITILSEDILGDKGDTTDVGVTRMDYAQEPIPSALCVRDNGGVSSSTYARDQDVIAWSNYLFGGTGVEIESIGVIPTSGQDRIWFIIKRTINSVTRRYVEHLDTQFRNRSVNTCIFSDSHLQFIGDTPAGTLTPGATTGSSVTFTASSAVFTSTDVGRFIVSGSGKMRIDTFTDTTHVIGEILSDFASTSAISSGAWNMSVNSISGLDHLEGETVKVLANGGADPDAVVTNGTIALVGQYNFIGVGLGYDKEVELLDIDFGSALGTAYGARAKVINILIEFFETVGGSIGYDEDKLTEVKFRKGRDNMGQGVAPFTGFKKERVKGGWRDSIKTLYRNSDPLPVTILAMVLKGTINE